ncbi:two-component regulator propeller domain-containing protein [Duganella sp. Dugasp56]|uniref:sensor histidine kinase n=1 Tax=Duganella sp. Dugasp56 TaxID=3243046 RepID=UPI0039AED044
MRYRRACLWLALTMMASPCRAISEGPFAAYFHTGWTPGDGAPAGVRCMVQDAAGWLWVGGASGLYRFDGNRFERLDAIGGRTLRKSHISALGWIDGALWVGYQFGGVERFKDGQALYFGKDSGLPQANVHQLIQQAAGGAVSAATSAGLFDWDGQRWTRAWPLGATGPDRVLNAFVAPDRSLWIQGGKGVWRRPAGGAFAPVDSDDPWTFTLFAVPGGGFWAAGANAGFMQYDAVARRFRRGPPAPASEHGNALYFLRDGSAWMGGKGGIQLLADTRSFGAVAALSRENGLSDAIIQTSYEDRDGNLWLGTTGGVDRIRRRATHEISLPKEGYYTPSVAADAHGGLWIGTHVGPQLRELRADGVWIDHQLSEVDNLQRAADGAIWAASHAVVARYAGGGEQRWPVPAEMAGPVQTMAPDRDGSLWLSVVGKRELLHLGDGAWQRRPDRMGYPDTAIYLFLDERGRLWQAYTDNRVAVADGAAITRYTDKDGLRIGNVLAILARGARLWVGGERALMFLHNGRFVALQRRDGSDFLGVSGIVERDNGDLWLHGLEGVSRIAAADVRRALGGGDARVDVERLDYKDGIVGQAPQVRPMPSLFDGGDGRIWYHTNSSVGWIDAGHPAPGRTAPPVRLLALATDAQSYAPGPGLRLPAGTGSLRIDYTALSLTMAERVNFRYRLEGSDDGWTEAGGRRSAYYTNLSPGEYRFQVQAFDGAGVRTADGAAQQFSIAPTVTQSRWFRALCAAAALLAAWLLHRWRLRRQAAQLRARLDERLDERGRIARELHDTLLQSVQGLVLKVHGVAVRMAPQEPMRGMLDAALVQAEDTIIEGRNRVRDLRSREEGRELVSMLAAVTQELTGEDTPPCDVVSVGEACALAPGIGGEVFAIGREAMLNAFRHAHAGKVTVVVAYRPRQLRLVVADDGVGMPPLVVAEGGRAGHWGFAGMRERAAGIGAELALRARQGGGTEWVLTLPAALAYAQRPRGGWRWRRCWLRLRRR